MKSIKSSKLKFNRAEATNTRLMGVVGVVTHWTDEAEREIVQIFHLDYELYGIDGFYHLIEPTEKALSELLLSVTGGLGGTFEPISFRELVYLLKSAYQVEPNSIETHVDFDAYIETFLTWQVDLTNSEILELMVKLNPPVLNPVHTINYLVMRLVGRDPVSTVALWDSGRVPEKMDFFDAPYTLIKNTSTLLTDDVTSDEATYRVEALIDYEHKYKLIVFKFYLNRVSNRVIRIEAVEELVISSIEAAFNLNKPEYILVTQIKDEFFERRFVENNPEMMKQTYYQGQLYIEFNPHNHHVSQNPYYLNGDIFAMYFFSRSGHLLIASFSKENLDVIDGMLIRNQTYTESLQFICELKTDDPILYAYINSNYETIFDYLSQ